MKTALILALILLLAGPLEAGDTALLDWGNRIARPIGAPDGYSAAELEAMAGRSLYLFAGRAVLTELGHAQARELAGEAPVIAYVLLAGVYHPDKVQVWPFLEAIAEVQGEPALTTEGELALSWAVDWSDDPLDQQYHREPYGFDPTAFAELVVAWARDRFPVDGVFLDYFARTPWAPPGHDPPAFASDPAALQVWRSSQILVAYHLRRLWPEAILIGNGRWANEEPAIVQPALLTGVYWERCGGLWWSPDKALEQLGTHTRGIQLLDPTPSARFEGWDPLTLARTAAALRRETIVIEPAP